MKSADFYQITNGILQVLNAEESFLTSLSQEILTTRANKQNRNIKQILGHLIDSASNNTHRIVHLQYQPNPLIFPDYANMGNNDKWIAIQNYQTEDWDNLVQLWKYSNLHLIHVINHVNQDKLSNEWISALGEVVSLKEMIVNYLPHLHLHISEIHELIQ